MRFSIQAFKEQQSALGACSFAKLLPETKTAPIKVKKCNHEQIKNWWDLENNKDIIEVRRNVRSIWIPIDRVGKPKRTEEMTKILVLWIGSRNRKMMLVMTNDTFYRCIENVGSNEFTNQLDYFKKEVSKYFGPQPDKNIVQVFWFISNTERNKMMHMIEGNGLNPGVSGESARGQFGLLQRHAKFHSRVIR